MAKGKLEFLSDEEIERIHLISLRILDEIGIKVHSESACELLESVGCIRSKDGRRVLIPESVVKSAISDAPKEILLVARDSKLDLQLPSDNGIYASDGGEGVYVKDLLTGESHPSTLRDVRDFSILVDEFPQVDFGWGMVGALDQPAHLKELMELRTYMEFSAKHIQSGALSSASAEMQIEFGSLIAGGEKEFRKRPIFSVIECPISPLTFEAGLIEAQITFSRAGIPLVAMSASIAGLTSPVTLAGTLAQVNAENLASLVISQAADRGAPWIYSSDSSPGDLRTGSIDYHALETLLLHVGAGQMGKSYGFPTMTAPLGIENRSLSLGNINDGLPDMMLQSIVPSDLGAGFGGIDQAAGASLEQFIVDVWIWKLAREFNRDFNSDDDAISIETIREASFDGTFLNKKHTIKRFKEEFLSAVHPVLSSKGRKQIEEKGTLIRKAKEEVQRILKVERESYFSDDEKRDMDEFIEKLR